MSELSEWLKEYKNDRHFKKNDVITLVNDNNVVIARKSKDEYVVYPLMQHSSPYKSYFKVKDEDIKCRSSIVIQ